MDAEDVLKTTERRQQRSASLHRAVSLYLESAARRSGARALALASVDGHLLAGAGDELDLEAVAALGAMGERASPRLVAWVTRGERFAAQQVEVHGLTFHLAAVGTEAPPFDDAAAALDRIFRPLFAYDDAVTS